MRNGLTNLRVRIERLAASVDGGCDDCRDLAPELICWDAVPEGEPDSEECRTCGRVIPIRYTVLQWQ